MFMIISIVAMFIALIGFYIFMGIWVYNDAKSRGDKAGIWTIVALITPSMMGVIAYILLRKEKSSGERNKFKTPMIVFFIALIISLGAILVSVLSISDTLPEINGVSIGMVENNIGNKWDISFKTSGERFERTLNLTDEQLENMTVKGECSEGKVYLLILQGDKSKILDLSDYDEQKPDLSEFCSGKIYLSIYNEHAKKAKINIKW